MVHASIISNCWPLDGFLLLVQGLILLLTDQEDVLTLVTNSMKMYV